MKRTSATTIVGSIAVSGVLSWIGLSFWRRAGHSLPPVPRMVVVVMLVMAIALFAAGWPVGLVTREAKDRSEEHTSELQSRGQLVCRLLLEKKNTFKQYTCLFCCVCHLNYLLHNIKKEMKRNVDVIDKL